MRLLLDCTTRTSKAPADRLEIPSSLDWRYFLELASWHGLSGLVRNTLDDDGLRRRVPSEIRADLRQAYVATAAAYQDLSAELRGVLTVLDSEDIPVILLKGLALAEPVYGDPALRPMGDLDLMVPEENLERADQLVRGMGYDCWESPELQKATRKMHRHYPRLTRRDGACEIELHRHILHHDTPLFFDVSSLWSRARPVAIGGHCALALAPEDLLTHLCLTFFLDRRLFYQSYRALGQLVDIARTVEHYAGEIDWDDFVRMARRNGHSGTLFCALWTARKLLRARICLAVLDALEPELFSSQLGECFVESKVLERRPWFFHDLVSPKENTTSNVIRSALHRTFFNRAYLEEKYSLPHVTHGGVYLFLRHALDLLLLAKRYFFHLGQLARDFRIDRWMHFLETGKPVGRRPRRKAG